MRKKWVAILSSALMITFFSGCGIFTNLSSDTPPPPDNQTKNVETRTTPSLTASEILSKSSDAMERMEGYKWQVNAVQDILVRTDLSRAKNTVRTETEFISTKELHNTVEITTESGGRTQSTFTELYSKNDRVYIKNSNSNSWAKWDFTDSRIRPILDNLERDYVNPNYILDTFRHEANSLQVSTEGEDYVLTISLKDDQKIRPFTKAATTNLTRDNNITDSQLNYKSLDLSIYINKTDFIINKLTQKLELDIPLKGQYDSTINQEQTIQFKGEVKEIILPAEVY